MAKTTVTLPKGYWERIQRILNESEVTLTREEMVDINYQKFANRVESKYKMNESDGIRLKAKAELKKKQKEKQFDKLAEEERQFKEEEKRALLDRIRYQVLQKDRYVRDFNRVLQREMITKDNNVLAAYQRKKRKTAQDQGGEMNPWYNAADQRMEREALERQRNTRALADDWGKRSHEKKQLKKREQILEQEETQKVMHQDACENQKKTKERERHMERQKQVIHQNLIKPRISKREQLVKAREQEEEEEERSRGIQEEFDMIQNMKVQLKEERIAQVQMRTKILSDHLEKIKKEEPARKGLGEEKILEHAADQLAKEKQKHKEAKEKKAAMTKLQVEALHTQMREKVEAKRREEEKRKESSKKLFEADRLYRIKKEQKILNARQDAIENVRANSVLGAERRARRSELKKQDREESRRMCQGVINVSEPVTRYIQSELHKAEEKGLNVQLMRKQMQKDYGMIHLAETPKPPKYLVPLAKRDADDTRLTDLLQAEANSHVLLTEKRRIHFLPPLAVPPKPQETMHDLLGGAKNHRTPLPPI